MLLLREGILPQTIYHGRNSTFLEAYDPNFREHVENFQLSAMLHPAEPKTENDPICS